jgi:aryl carrier-like protein
MNRVELKIELAGLIQDTVETRPLDSLEMLVVRTLIRSKGTEMADDEGPSEPTIKGWMEWLCVHSPDG